MKLQNSNAMIQILEFQLLGTISIPRGTIVIDRWASKHVQPASTRAPGGRSAD